MLRPKRVRENPKEAYDIGMIKPKNLEILSKFSNSSIHSLLFFLTSVSFNRGLLLTSSLGIFFIILNITQKISQHQKSFDVKSESFLRFCNYTLLIMLINHIKSLFQTNPLIDLMAMLI